ncbi:hypothetical protein FACS1894189_1430 [Planctomycetales bacterium]|nr:hypothetical protein FACS1894189_1430 [Planctomycetales bacterium]
MKLYHGSIVKVETPQVIEPVTQRTVDFGNGFYTTTDFEQAERWARIRQKRDKIQDGFVSIYETDDDLLQKPNLKCLVFNSATLEWLQFVMKNRKSSPLQHDYDIVAGPVANDKVYTTLTLFEMEQLEAEEAIRHLKTYNLVNQILFHTEKSLQQLRYTGSEKIQ